MFFSRRWRLIISLKVMGITFLPMWILTCAIANPTEKGFSLLAEVPWWVLLVFVLVGQILVGVLAWVKSPSEQDGSAHFESYLVGGILWPVLGPWAILLAVAAFVFVWEHPIWSIIIAGCCYIFLRWNVIKATRT